MSETMDYAESRNNLDSAASSRGPSPSNQSIMDVRDEELESLLLDGIAKLTQLRAEVAEMQVELIKLEDSFSRANDPRLLEAAREVLDDDINDAMGRLDEMDSAN